MNFENISNAFLAPHLLLSPRLILSFARLVTKFFKFDLSFL